MVYAEKTENLIEDMLFTCNKPLFFILNGITMLMFQIDNRAAAVFMMLNLGLRSELSIVLSWSNRGFQL